ncbi:putative lipoprotein DUF2279 [Novosphingobium sp. PhB55]|uniref:DUF2279 domain-containing protein n=1 Tax=Novosphingobium sp. PhB55 TaxID=2485106 RepID=UPI0010671104|nr:DUF2279 domain-containing protein [Novosphingobium sp. PhB55]TDW62746.1 putative lipoprotein DUF2279 [Novosphingobium sp. PhB55]
MRNLLLGSLVLTAFLAAPARAHGFGEWPDLAPEAEADASLAQWDLADLAEARERPRSPFDTPLSGAETGQVALEDPGDAPLVRPSGEPGAGPGDRLPPMLPADLQPRRWSDHVPRAYAANPDFFSQLGTIKWETLILLGYFSLQSGKKLFRETTSFHFHNEGWFGKDTTNLGIDKLTHAFDTYLIAEILHMRLHDKTHASQGDAVTAAILASTFMALNEISDGIETDSGYSMQDITMNLVGAGFSILRNTVPGMREKVAFKIEIIPDDNIYSYRGQAHYAQQRYMLSFKGAGFEGLKRTPLRFVDLQVGYYGSDFMIDDRLAGKEPKRHLFVGLGLNLGELLFGRSRSRLGKAGYTVLDYFQVPYTSIRYDTTGHLGT